MIKINSKIEINENEISIDFIHSSGPGGQNVNKVSTAVQLRFNITNSSLEDYIKNRLISMAKNRISKEGFLIITARKFRKQDQNKKEAINRLIELINKASVKPKSRTKTKPTFGSKKKRLEEKSHNSKIKKTRKHILNSED